MRHDVVEDMVNAHMPPRSFPEQWDTDGLKIEFHRVFNVEPPIDAWLQEDGISETEVGERLQRVAEDYMAARAAKFGPEPMRWLEKNMLLQTVDQQWKDHLHQLDHLRQTVTLRAYGQRDPLNEYKSEAFEMFESLMNRVRVDVCEMLAHVEIRFDEPPPPPKEPFTRHPMQATHLDPQTGENEMDYAAAGQRGFDKDDPSTWGRVPRNAPCPCGSGQKYKRCHGAIASAAS
jgi:preprotein translocase subunit SecA